MNNVHDDLGIKNMSDLVLKEIYGKYERKKYRITEREIFEKYDNLGENDLNKKDNKWMSWMSEMML